MNSFLSEQEIKNIGFKRIGSGAQLSRYAQFYSPNLIEIGDNVRIDDFCILSGKIKLGNYIHISAYSALYGKYGIEMENFTGLSPRCTVLSASDDFSGENMIGPMLPEIYTNVTGGKVIIKQYSQIGADCTILPDIVIEEGVAVGAMSLINNNLRAWAIYSGIPAKYKKPRSKNLLSYNFHGQ